MRRIPLFWSFVFLTSALFAQEAAPEAAPESASAGDAAPADSTEGGAPGPEAPPPPPPRVMFTESDYVAVGMPPVGEAWDERAFVKVAEVIAKLGSERAQDLPGADTEYGPAFFRKLQQTASGLQRLPAARRIEAQKALMEILPVYEKALSVPHKYDMEVALLVSLEFEQMAGLVDDPTFLLPKEARKPRTSTGLDGTEITIEAVREYFIADAEELAKEVEANLQLIANQAVIGPEARALALSRSLRDVYKIARRLKLPGIRQTLANHQAAETDETVRAWYERLVNQLER